MSSSARRRLPNPSGRAQSESLGLVLVFAIVIAGATVVVVFGAAAFDESESTLSAQRAEKSMTQFDSKAALVALGNTDVQSVSLPRRGSDQFRVVNGTGWMNVTVYDTVDDTWENVTQPLGAITYQNGDAELAYQGGGVWRSDTDGSSVMVSPPEFHFRNGTLTLPIINVTGDASLGSGAAVSRVETIREFPDRNVPERQNPLDHHQVYVEVQSEYYEAWGKYFEERTEGNVEYDHADEKVTLELVTPLGDTSVTNALAGLSEGDLTISGSAGDTDCGFVTITVYVDSYDSTDTTDGYCDQYPGHGQAGNITYGGNMDFGGSGTSKDLNGNITAGGWIEFNNDDWDVHGDIYYVDYCHVEQHGTVDCDDPLVSTTLQPDGDDTTQISTVVEMSPMDGYIEEEVDRLSDPANNDNGGPISGNTLSGGSMTLDAGSYYLEHLRLAPSDSLTFDLCSGSITVAVEGDVELQRSGGSAAEIVVDDTGCSLDDENVTILVNDDSAHTDGDDLTFDLQKNAEVRVDNDNSTRFRLIGKEDFEAQLGESGNRATFVGVIYAPVSSPSADGEVRINKADVFGGLVTGDTTLETGASLHYDEALRNTQVASRNAKVVKVTYLHVTVNRIHVASG